MKPCYKKISINTEIILIWFSNELSELWHFQFHSNVYMSIKVSSCCCELKRPDGEWKQFTYIKCLPSDPVLILAIEMTETCLKNYSVSLFRIVQGVLQRSMKLDTTHKLLVVRINVSSLTARRQPFRLHKYPESLLQ